MGINTLLIIAVLAIAEGGPLILIPLGAALCHELGHVIVMLALGAGVREIEITLFGAEIRSISDSQVGTIGQAAIYAAGAAANIATGIAALSFGYPYFAYCSFALAAVNLLPIETLDGGCILELLVRRITFRYADGILRAVSVLFIFLLWLAAVYFLLVCGGNLSLMLFCAYMFVTLYLNK